jgi:hypothetical protein
MLQEMVAYVIGARLGGDKRPALEILALAGKWPGRAIVANAGEVERQARRHCDKKVVSRCT